MAKQRLVVVCPGRGSYTAETLGYLNPHRSKIGDFIEDLDSRRKAQGDPTITELDQAEKFKMSLHTKGEHASVLIYACAFADFCAINREKYEVVAVTGNSMGWYLALAMAGGLDSAAAFEVIQTMGGQMRKGLIGGQVIYPLIDEQWLPSQQKKDHVASVIADMKQQTDFEVYDSIYLGGYRVWGGNRSGLAELLKRLEPEGKYPFQLVNHGAFHTPLLNETSQKAFSEMPASLFQKPKIPLVDGRGKIWQGYSTDVHQLYDYTLGHQVVEPYDFTAAVSVALKEFAPDKIALLGPGNSLGGVVGQILIENGIYSDKTDFQESQKKDPFLVSMGVPEQAQVICG